jgi:ribonucleoside-diphosphate reductase alpha chain
MTKEYSYNAIEIYKRLYFDKTRNELTPEEVHKRVASFIGSDDKEKENFENLLNSGMFRPNSPCLMNAGKESDKLHDKQLCACFVLGLEDSMDSIIEMWGLCAKIYASGAGAGIPITNLRENKSPISSGGEASGPLRYLKVVDLLSETVRSGGRTRRAANIGTFNYNHPETIDIIESKNTNELTLTSFNLSMAVTDSFMKALDVPEATFDIISPNQNKKINELKVQELWDLVSESAWKTGDPGLLFIDHVNKYNPFPSLGLIHSTNPCGEVPLHPWSVCNIGSINLNPFLKTCPGFVDLNFKPFFKWDLFREKVHQCINFLDNVIDATSYLHPKFEEVTKKTRPIGLGIMGFADILIKMGIKYGSEESIKLFEELCYNLNKYAIEASIDLVAEKGREPIEIPEADKEHFRNLLVEYVQGDTGIIKKYDDFGIRNSTWTCIAPTGSIAMTVDASYAWEPLMALIWEKPLADSDQVLKIIYSEFEKQLDKLSSECNEKKETIIEDIIKNKGSIQHIPYIPQKYKDLFVVAHDINPLDKIRMQGAGQKYISMAISSTCNLPNSATTNDIKQVYEEAHRQGLKGITIYRDNCRSTQVVNFGGMQENKVIEKRSYLERPLQRPIKRKGETVEIPTPYGKLFVTCNHNNEQPFEIFFRVGKQGALTNVLIDALGRVCSKALQAGIPIDIIVDTLRGLKGDKFWYKIDDDIEKPESAESIVDAIAQLIDYHWNKKVERVDNFMQSNLDDVTMDCLSSTQCDECPKCHRKTLRHDTGCRGGLCTSCGFSACD